MIGEAGGALALEQEEVRMAGGDDKAKQEARCSSGGGERSRAALSLPIVETHHGPEGAIRPSKSGKRRAIVLLIVQLLIIAHIVLWALSKQFGWFDGRTISPVEPSESMEFTKQGVINAGLVFFAIALLSTLVLGRWFCGWGCHVVLLQDLCGWMMKKMGVRPKPFRSRLLVYVPLLLAVYMFLWPGMYRWGVLPADAWLARSLGEDHWSVEGVRGAFATFGVPVPARIPAWRAEWHLTTDDFWRTFPGAAVTVPFLLICGFATVYFLGAKGFCTYGCPYGGFFAPLDRFAPGSIRVTDACEQCGHCTAVCTSNVRVHEEVREYGMVVDPGCMKCLDCVSVCPKEALYFGFGAPSILKGAPKHEKPKKKYDMTWGEELSIALVFALSFFAVRGVYGVVPLLMAVGIAGVLAFMTWKLWRLVRDEHVGLHRFRMKYRGKLHRSGWVFAGITALALGLTAHSGAVNLFLAIGNRHDERVLHPAQYVFTDQKVALPESMVAPAERAIRFLTLASSMSDGGIGLLATGQSQIDLRLAWLNSALGRFDEAEQRVERMIARDGLNEGNATSMFRILFASGQRERAMAFLLETGAAHPGFFSMLSEGTAWLIHEGEGARALELTEQVSAALPGDLAAVRLHAWVKIATGDVEGGLADAQRSVEQPRGEKLEFRAGQQEPLETQFLDNIVTELLRQQRLHDALQLGRAGMKQYPESLLTMRRLSMMEMQFGDLREGILLIERTIEIDATSAGAYYHLSLAYAASAQFEQAYEAMRKAMELSEVVPMPWCMQMSEICAALGRTAEAQSWQQRAEQMNP